MRNPSGFEAVLKTEYRRSLVITLVLAGSFAMTAAAQAPKVRVTQFPTPTASSGPQQTAQADANHLFYTEFVANNIALLNVTNGLTWEWALGSNANPHYVQSMGRNALFAEQGSVPTQNGAVGVLNPFTNTVSEWSIPNGSPRHLVLVGHLVYFADQANNSVSSLNLLTNVLTQYPVPTANAGLSGIAASADGKAIFFVEVSTANIGRLVPATNTITEWHPAGTTFFFHIHTLQDSHIFFGNNSTSADIIGLLDPNTTLVTEWSSPTPNQAIGDVIGQEIKEGKTEDQEGFNIYFDESPAGVFGKLNTLQEAGTASTATVIGDTVVTPSAPITITPATRTLPVTATIVTRSVSTATGTVTDGFVEWPVPAGTTIKSLFRNGVAFTNSTSSAVGIIVPIE
jgi:streptogramin lyase